MAGSLISRLKNAWNVFNDGVLPYQKLGISSSIRPDRPRFTRGTERTIVNAFFTRIAIDCSSVTIQHAKLDKNGRYLEPVNSGLNNCLNLEANIDQSGRDFIFDSVISMLDEGCVALVPVDTIGDPRYTSSYDICSLRTGKILEWYPENVKVRVYNDRTGQREDVIVSKRQIAIVENPLYPVINEPNSTMQRLIRKLSLLDMIDERNSSGKLDLIIQLPYVVKTETKKQQAERRRSEIEDQLVNSKYGIAYTDGTERITQLNRPVENTLMSQVEYLTSMLYSQLGMTQGVLDGSANEKEMLNYYSRITEPILSALVNAMKRTFLTKTARTQGQSIVYFRDPFKLVPVNEIAEIADKFTRNEIMSSNEIRQVIGLSPSDDPNADKLQNKNLKAPESTNVSPEPKEEEIQNEE